MAAETAAPRGRLSRRSQREDRPRRPLRARHGHTFVAAYLVLLLAFGVLPTGYALYLSVTNSAGQLVGVGNFLAVAHDFRFTPAFEHVALYLAIWLVVLIVLVVGLALLLHGRMQRTTSTLRFVYYLPGALAGVASVLVWLFMMDPTVSPIGWLLHWLGYTSFAQTIEPAHLPVVLAVIAFWTGAGGWIVIMYGALNNIPGDLLEAARIDGAGPAQIARRIQIPMLRKWIAYMVILAFATGSQLFVEPQLVGEASLGAVSNSWSPNQLAYLFAFQANNFHSAAALSVDLLVLGLICAAIVVTRSGLFDVE
jgi:multiple sugar transport system permease protein